MTSNTSMFSRRNLLSGAGAFVGGIGTGLWWAKKDIVEIDHHRLDLQEVTDANGALARLVAGNKCYVSEHFNVGDNRRTMLRRNEVVERQHPYAIILSCSDSRVAPEIVFSAGLGDLFVVRVAGNIADPRCFGVLGSLEYAVEELKIPLVVVLGHEGCGAVKAAIRAVREQIEFPGAIGMLAAAIKPTIEKIADSSDSLLPKAVEANVVANVNSLKSTEPLLATRFHSKQVRLLGAIYDLKTGLVRFLSE